MCARKRAERKRHAALGGKVPAALPDIEQPPAQESAAQEQAETEQPTKPLQEGQPMSHPAEQFKMPGASGRGHGTPTQHICLETVVMLKCCLSNMQVLLVWVWVFCSLWFPDMPLTLVIKMGATCC